jgi:hypothetical protein
MSKDAVELKPRNAEQIETIVDQLLSYFIDDFDKQKLSNQEKLLIKENAYFGKRGAAVKFMFEWALAAQIPRVKTQAGFNIDRSSENDSERSNSYSITAELEEAAKASAHNVLVSFFEQSSYQGGIFYRTGLDVYCLLHQAIKDGIAIDRVIDSLNQKLKTILDRDLFSEDLLIQNSEESAIETHSKRTLRENVQGKATLLSQL